MDDLIDRQGAIDTIGKMQTYKLFEGDDMILIDRAEAQIDLMLLPSAERKGKWFELDSDEDKYDIIKCSYCKHTFTVDSYHWTDIGFIKSDFKYCPNCGARMEP